MHSSRLTSIAVIFVALVAMLFCARISEGDEWLPVSPQELKVTGERKAPGAPAIILYRQIDRDDSDARTPHEYNYVRTKILTEEGRKYADVEIPFFKENEDVVNVRARTIRPDGSIVNFDGKVYEKEIVRARSVKFLAKTFTLSDVQPGSIIEYHYMIDFKEYYVFNSHWTLSEELFTRVGKYSLKPYGRFACNGLGLTAFRKAHRRLPSKMTPEAITFEWKPGIFPRFKSKTICPPKMP